MKNVYLRTTIQLAELKVNGQYYCDVLLSQQMLPAIKLVAERCLFTKQYVAYGEIGHFLCSEKDFLVCKENKINDKDLGNFFVKILLCTSE